MSKDVNDLSWRRECGVPMQGREAGQGGMWLAGFLSAKLIQQGEEVTRERIEANEISRSDP
jgi:hypothetical protein